MGPSFPPVCAFISVLCARTRLSARLPLCDTCARHSRLISVLTLASPCRGVSGKKAADLRAVRAFHAQECSERSGATLPNALSRAAYAEFADTPGVDEERGELLERRGQVLRRLAVLRERESHLSTSCSAVRKQLEQGSASYRERRSAADETRIFLTLLRAHRHKIEVQLAIVREYSRRLSQGVDMGVQHGDTGDAGDASRRERREIAALCEEIAGAKSASGGGCLDHAAAEMLSGRLSKLSIPADKLMSILCDQTAQGSTELLELESSPAVPDGKGGMAKVRVILGEMRKMHLKLFEETEAVRHETVATLGEADYIVRDIETLCGTGAHAEMLCAQQRQQRELASASSAAAAVERVTMTLRGTLEDAQGKWESVSKGQGEVRGLVDAVLEQQQLAGDLLVRNAQRGVELRGMQSAMADACCRGIVDAVPALREACDDAVSAAKNEAELFNYMEHNTSLVGLSLLSPLSPLSLFLISLLSSLLPSLVSSCLVSPCLSRFLSSPRAST